MRPLTERQVDVMESLAVYGGSERRWARPMDIGSWDGSHHTATLVALIGRKYVERRLRGTFRNVYIGGGRGSYEYRLTARGWGRVVLLRKRKRSAATIRRA